MRVLLAMTCCAAILASCDKNGETDSVREPEQKRPTDGQPGDRPPTNEAQPMTWDQARDVAVAYYTKTAGAEFAKRLQAHPRIQFLFTNSSDTVLVHAGAVVTSTGLSAFEDFLRGRDAAELEALTAEDITLLVRLFEAFPPMEDHDPQRFYDAAELPNLRPTWTWNAGTGTFRVNYRVSDDERDDQESMPIVEWAIDIDGKTPLAWQSRPRTFDERTNTFPP